MRRRAEWSAVLVAAWALLTRIVAMGVGYQPGTEFEKFFALAGELMRDGWVSGEVFGHAPSYVYFLAVLMALGASPVVVCVVQVVLGVVTCLAVWEVTRRVFGLGEATVAGLWFASFGPHLVYTISFESDGFGVFLYAVAAVAVMAAVQRPSVARFGLAGALLGLRIAQRPNAALLLPLVAAVIWWGLRMSCDRWRRVLLAAVLCAGAALPVLPVTWQNARACGELIPVIPQGGWVFYTGNNHLASGLSYYPPPLATAMMHQPLRPGERRSSRYDEAVSRRLAGLVAGRALSPGEASRFWFGEGMDCVRRRGWRQLGLELRKLRYMLHAYDAHDNLPLLLKQEALGGLTVLGMGTVSPFALLGLGLAVGGSLRRRPELWLVVALAAIPAISMGVFYVGSRFRLELAAALVAFAAYGLCWFVGVVRQRRIREVGSASVLLVVLGLVCNLSDGEIERQERQRTIILHTGIARRAVELPEACAEYARAAAVARHPGEADEALRGLASCQRLSGDVAGAARSEAMANGVLPPEVARALAADRDDLHALWALGRHSLATGEPARAGELFGRAMEVAPNDPEVAFARAAASLEAGAVVPEQALVWLEHALACGLRFSSNAPQAYLLVARCRMAEGRWHEAETAVSRALVYEPDSPTALGLREELRRVTR